MIELVLAATLMLRDPPGDAVGAGSLVPPSAEQYRNPGSFDLLGIQVLDSPMFVFEIEMGALPNPAGLANGFSNPVVDVYLDLGEGGTEVLLPGPDMRMPASRGWELALRITGDGATAYRSDDDVTSGPAISYPVHIATEDRTIRVETPFERTEVEGMYALTGVYDPFIASGWRALADAPSPWTFSSVDQRRPVVDLLAPDAVAQGSAIRSGVLPRVRERSGGTMWVLLMGLGVIVAAVGLALRRMVTAPLPAVPAAEAPGAMPAGEAPDAAASAATAGVPPGAAPRGATRQGVAAVATQRMPVAPAAAATVPLPVFLPALPPPRDAAPPPDSASDFADPTNRELAGSFAAADVWADDESPEEESAWEERAGFDAFAAIRLDREVDALDQSSDAGDRDSDAADDSPEARAEAQNRPQNPADRDSTYRDVGADETAADPDTRSG